MGAETCLSLRTDEVPNYSYRPYTRQAGFNGNHALIVYRALVTPTASYEYLGRYFGP